jgi:hypothetical protein
MHPKQRSFTDTSLKAPENTQCLVLFLSCLYGGPYPNDFPSGGYGAPLQFVIAAAILLPKDPN